jgi:hypothetical protein
MRIFTTHKCDRVHASWRELTHCVYSRRTSVTGNGPYAVVSYCAGQRGSIALRQSEASAVKAFDLLAKWGCREGCQNKHEIIHLDMEIQK